MNQIVYVVTDLFHHVIIGAYNEYEDALNAVKEVGGMGNPCVQVTPVLVDAPADEERVACDFDDEVKTATMRELDIAAVLNEDEDEDEEEEEELSPKAELVLTLVEEGLSEWRAMEIADSIYKDEEDEEDEEDE